ncbi:MAG TPA: hypothetical protein VF899_18425 [Pyrinomonadaceae bacterium]
MKNGSEKATDNQLGFWILFRSAFHPRKSAAKLFLREDPFSFVRAVWPIDIKRDR